MTARPFVISGELRRLEFDIVPPAPLFSARRRSDDGEGRARGVIDTVGERVRRIESQLEEFRSEY